MQQSSFPELQAIQPLSKSDLIKNKAQYRAQFIQEFEKEQAELAAASADGDANTTSPTVNPFPSKDGKSVNPYRASNPTSGVATHEWVNSGLC